MYSKSPFNYIGNKYRMMEALQHHFPQDINTFVDLFCGGCDVTINTDAKRRIANDVNYHVIDIMREFQGHTKEEILDYLHSQITERGLSKTNGEAYVKLRNEYNSGTRNPLDLFLLVCHSFNYQFRFNAAHEYNNPFGKNRSEFTAQMENNLAGFIPKIQGVELFSVDFRDFDYTQLQEGDFVYADPPYLLTCGSYNDGKRGFNGWDMLDDDDLTRILDSLNASNIKFALSNVICHKNQEHPLLQTWVAQRGYNLHDININYNNCNYQASNRNYQTREVLITNY